MNRADLHVHSRFSNDGEFGVQEIIGRCLHNEIDILSITDHNSTNAIEEAITLCRNYNIDLIPGIEIDCSYNNIDLHLLGYNIDWLSRDFKELQKSIHDRVMDSFPLMIENLGKAGIRVDENEVMEKANGKLPCGELIAEVLLNNPVYHSNKKLSPYMKGGERSDMPYINFYHDYFAQGKPAYVKINYMDFHDAVSLVKSNGGIPVVAHPGMNLKGEEGIVIELLEDGAEGLEAFNNYHNDAQIEYFAGLAVERSVLMTCGSDFHGKNKPLIDIGKYKASARYDEYLQKSISKIKDRVSKRY